MHNLKLVEARNGIVYTTSRKIAEKFGKQHKHVLNDIRKLAAEISDAKMFIETTYKNRGKEYTEYLVSQDGLTLYLMNMHGFVAEKMEYINQFNTMKQLIIDLQLGKPEAIISLLTWKNTNMETTIRAYVNGGNVLNVLPAIAEECKKQELNGEDKVDVLATAIRTAREMRDEEENIAYRELYHQAIEEATAIKERIFIGRMGGTTASKNRLEAKCKRLQEKTYEEEDFFDYINTLADDKDLQIYRANMKIYVGYICNVTGKEQRTVYNNIYSNVIDRYCNLYLPTAKSVKEQGYKSLLEYFFVTQGVGLLNEFAGEAYSWSKKLGYNQQQQDAE